MGFNIFDDEEEYDIPDFNTFMPGRLGDQMDFAANRYGLDPEMFTRLVGQESRFNPSALSEKGAAGFTQLMPGTAGDLGVNPADEEENLLGGAKYLAQQIDRYNGNEELGLAAYNAGAGNVDKYGGIPPFAETQDYVSKITGKPLPQLPILSRVRGRSGNVAENRLAMRDSLTSQIEALADTKQKALEGINTDGNLDTDSAIAIALSAILPTLIGWGMNGRQGAAAGAESGAAGANAGLTMAQQQIKNRNDVNKFVYTDAAQRLAQRQGDLQRVEDGIADRDERNNELEYLYGSPGGQGGARNQAKNREPLSPEQSAVIARMRNGEELSAKDIELLGTIDPYRLQTVVYGTGSNQKRPGDSQLDRLTTAKEAKANILSVQGLLDGVDPGALSALAAGQITDLYKDPSSNAYRMYAKLELLKKQVARMNDSGALTQLDVEMFQPLTVGSPIYDDKESLKQRMIDLMDYIETKEKSVIESNRAGGRVVTPFRNGAGAAGSPPPTMEVNGKTLRLKGKR